MRALLVTFVCHGLAMLGMVMFLLPALPGGGADDVARMAHVAAHPWLFRLGWLPWQLTALSDLYLAWALVRAPWIARGYAWSSLVLTVMAVMVDQSAQVLWITRGVALAEVGDFRAYMALEATLFPMTGWYAAFLYTLGAIGWSLSFARVRTGPPAWSRGLTWMSIVLWGLFSSVTVGPLFHMPADIVAAGNAMGFVVMEIWFLLVAERVLRRSRPDRAHGRYERWRHPRRGLGPWICEGLANSRLLRTCLEPLRAMEFQSDIRDVVYMNYLVGAERLAAYVPEGLTLQRLGPSGRWAMFTIVTYRHGNFGPAFLGRFRRLFSSPVQSNWRTYVKDETSGKCGVYFVTNAVTTRLHALGARLMAEGMPMHLLARGDVSRDGDGGIDVVLDPGAGSAPDCEAHLRPSDVQPFASPWSECFADMRAALAYAVPQDRAMSTQPWAHRLTLQEIELGIPLDACEPLSGEVLSRAARAIAGDAPPFCFRVARVSFRFVSEMRARSSSWVRLPP